MIVDLQVNLETPDGAPVEPDALVEGAKTAGLDGVVLLKDGELRPDVAPYAAAGEAHGLAVFSGTRLATNHGLILCIFPSGDIELSDGWAAKEDDIYDASAVIDAVEERGGVTVALRPYDREVARPMGDHLFSLQGLNACEVNNAGLTDVANDLALEAASNMEMPCVGTSDAKGVQGLGTVATLFRTPVGDASELCEAIRTGDCWPLSFSDQAPAAPRREDRGGRGGRGRGGRGRGGGRDRDNNRGGRGRGRRDGNREGGAREGGAREGGNREGGNREGGNREGGNREGGTREGGTREEGGNRESANRSRPVGRENDRDAGRRRGGRGGRGRSGGGGGGSRRPDGFGNMVTEAPRNTNIDENAGNRIRNDNARKVAEDIGNRLRPGEDSPYRPGNEPGPDDDY